MLITEQSVSQLPGAQGVAMLMLADGREPTHTRIDIAHLKQGASLPKHRAGSTQQFYVISGHGRVASTDDIEHSISPGTLVKWEPGEEHTSWADTDMTVLIIQYRPT